MFGHVDGRQLGGASSKLLTDDATESLDRVDCMERWSDYFRRSSLGTGVFTFRPNEVVTSNELAEHVLRGGGCVLNRSGVFSPVYQAMPLPGGAAFGVAQRYGFGGLAEGWKVAGPRALRHLLRLIDLPQPTRRLSGEEDAPPATAGLAEEWDSWVADGLQSHVAQALPWLTIDGTESFQSAAAAPPVLLPLDSKVAADATELFGGPGLRSSIFWASQISGKTKLTTFTVSPDGVALK